ADIDDHSDDRTRASKNEFNITSYRIGSVGQDTQICLWDLTDDVIRQAKVIKSRSSMLATSSGHHSANPSGIGDSSSKLSPLPNGSIGPPSSASNHHHHHPFFNSLMRV